MIAEVIGVHKSTITRELQRNGKVISYNAQYAQKQTETKRKKAMKAIKLTEEMKVVKKNKKKIPEFFFLFFFN